MSKSAMAAKTSRARAYASAGARWMADTSCMLQYMHGEAATRYNRADIVPDYPRYSAGAHVTASGRFRFSGEFYMEYRHAVDGGYDWTLADGPQVDYAALQRPRTIVTGHARDLAQLRGVCKLFENQLTPELFRTLVH